MRIMHKRVPDTHFFIFIYRAKIFGEVRRFLLKGADSRTIIFSLLVNTSHAAG